MCSSPHWQVGQSWFREKLSPANREQRLSRWADFAKNCLPRIGSKVLPRFRGKYRALGRQKNGVQHATAIYPIPRYTRPRYIGLTLYKDKAITWTNVDWSSVMAPWHSLEGNFTGYAQDIYPWYELAASPRGQWINTLRPRQNGRHLPDDIFKCISLNENVCISIEIPLKFCL